MEYKVYDFKRPDKFSHDQIITLKLLHNDFINRLINTWSDLFNRKVEIVLQEVDQLTYGEFAVAAPERAATALISMKPLHGVMLMQMDPVISSMFLDRICGGSGSIHYQSDEFGFLDSGVCSALYEEILDDYKESWQRISAVEPKLEEFNAASASNTIVSDNEMIILVSLKVGFGEESGYLNIVLPFLTLETVIELCSCEQWYSSILKHKGEVSFNRLKHLSLQGEVVVVTEEVNTDNILQLKPGDMLKLPRYREGEMVLKVGGERLFDLNSDGKIIKRGIIPTILEKSRSEENSPLKEQVDDISRQLSELKTLLEKPERIELPDRLERDENNKNLSFLNNFSSKILNRILEGNHPQIITLVLSRIDRHLAAEILANVSGETQVDLAYRMSKMESVGPFVLSVIINSFREKLRSISESGDSSSTGLEVITEILNNSPRAVEKHVILSLEEIDNSVAESIKQRMFVFEDIVLLDARCIEPIINRTGLDDFALSLKMCDRSVVEHVKAVIPENLMNSLNTAMDELGRVRISDVDMAQLRVVNCIKEMEEQGEILVCRPDEMVE